MADRQATRRLAAIVSADVVGYSRLMAEDETATLEAMKAHRHELWTPKIEGHGGRVVGTAGDSVLVEFQSAVAAVECSVAIQRGMADRNVGLPEDRRMLLRVGINIGEVVVDGEDIFGDGVNVAARLEALAEPGGICVSDDVMRQIQGKLDLAFTDGSLKDLKNIPAPIHVWHWSTEKPTPANAGEQEATLELPDKPSIAVLPFDNMSGDPEQEYFADGIAEDIITALSRVGWFFVIARNSSFTYKGRAVDVKQVASELGVRYVLEGSVRKSGSRLRVTSQLIDATTGNHIWADRYDGQLDDIFDLQDQITESVVGAIEPKLRSSEIARVMRKRPDSLDAYDYVLRASPYLAGFRKPDFEEARTLLQKAMDLEPRYATALAYAALCRAFAVFLGWSADPSEDVAEGLRLARAAVAADPEDPAALRVAGWAQAYLAREHDAALALIDRSLALDPNSAMAWGFRGWTRIWDEQIDESLEDFERAIRLSPFDAWSAFYAAGMACVLTEADRTVEALRWARKAVQDAPEWAPSYRRLAATLARLGRLDEARDAARQFLELEPNFTLRKFDEISPFKGGPGYQRFRDDLAKAGLPE